MSRTKLDYRIKKINDYYYFKLSSMNNFRTTHQKSKTKAINYVTELMKKQSLTSSFVTDASTLTFRQYAKDFFDYEKCPNLILRESGLYPVKLEYLLYFTEEAGCQTVIFIRPSAVESAK